ncbi:hypothetical protein U8V72_17505 [Priestia filamentosa]|uniref:hypothetical protein n=1 Tax=Priestia filamentosa TaxID=1402861 RepID=UPI00397870EA
MTNDNNIKEPLRLVPDARDMIEQLRLVIEETDDSKYTLEELTALIIENNKHIAARGGFVAPSTERIYEVMTRNELDKLEKEGVLLKSISDNITYYKI